MDPKKGSLFPLIGFPADRHRLGTGFSAPAVPTICIWWQNSSANGRKPSPNMLDSDLYLSALALPLFVLCPVFFLRPSSLGSSYLSPVLRPEAVCFFNLVCRRHVSSGLVGLVEPTGDMCPSVIRTLLLRRLTIRANDWAGRDFATFATVCKFDVWEGQTQCIQYYKSLIRNSKRKSK